MTCTYKSYCTKGNVVHLFCNSSYVELVSLFQDFIYKVQKWHICLLNYHILNETSKPPLNIFSNILTYMIHKWLQFTLNMENQLN